MRQTGGYIDVVTAPGHGATFAICLPKVTAVIEQQGMSAGSTVSAVGSETILLVEDDDSVRALGARALRQYGYTVLPARHAEEGLMVADHYDSRIDLLLTDIVMPGLNGRELASRLQQSRRDLKVLYMSGYSDDTAAVRDVQRDGHDLVEKPYTLESLARRVREALDRP